MQNVGNSVEVFANNSCTSIIDKLSFWDKRDNFSLSAPRHNYIVDLEAILTSTQNKGRSYMAAPDKRGHAKYFSYFFTKTHICCWYSLEEIWRGASNEYPQCMFYWRNNKNSNTFRWKKLS